MSTYTDVEEDNGGDLDFLSRFISKPIMDLREKGIQTEVFVILGNDDPRTAAASLERLCTEGSLHYVNERAVPFGDLFVAGYSYVPPSPFLLKDWELYDVSRYVPPGSVPPDAGFRTVPVDSNRIRNRTMAMDLKELAEKSPPDRTIYLFHAPPANTCLDRAATDGRFIDGVPMDHNIGSMAIRRFIERYQPPITLHGHVHESRRISGSWNERLGKTLMINAANDGPELALVRFDTDDPKGASLELVPSAKAAGE